MMIKTDGFTPTDNELLKSHKDSCLKRYASELQRLEGRSSADVSIDVFLRIKDRVLDAAAEASMSAAMNGSHGDNGSRALVHDLVMYACGFQNVIPPDWDVFVREFDPEFKEYQRLKAKFEK